VKFLVYLIVGAASIVAVSADDQPLGPATNPPPERRKSALEESRGRNPEALEKLREKRREEVERRRDEVKKLPPEERQGKMKELRERAVERRKTMTREEMIAKRQEIKSRFERQLGALRQKQTDGTLTAQESKRLQRLETIAQRFKQAEAESPSASP
jgi:PERQ amino acid-rich with GYF domain-containing protein